MERNKMKKNNTKYSDDQSNVKKWDRDTFFKNGCPDCGSNDFLEGPSGGLSINIKCAKCDHKFNDMWVFGVERI